MIEVISWFVAMFAMLFLVGLTYFCATLGTWIIIGDTTSPYQDAITGALLVMFGGLSLHVFRHHILARL